MIEIEKPKIETVDVSEDGAYGKFVVERLSADMERPWGIPFAGSCCPRCQAQP
ncbi:DNA-directed RNA polymerase subunit alpha [Paenibacillus sp. P1XP2]|nr:DNA-directed RNA polymerase subunit alpha [Paenibacillus sp. P1XP2]